MKFGINYKSILKIALYVFFVSAAAGLTEGINYVSGAGLDPSLSVIIVSVMSLALKQVKHEIEGHD